MEALSAQASDQRADFVHHRARDGYRSAVEGARFLMRRRGSIEKVDLDLDQAIAAHTDGPPLRNGCRIRAGRRPVDRDSRRENRSGDLDVSDLALQFEHAA